MTVSANGTRPFVETPSLCDTLVQMMQNLLIGKDMCIVGARGKMAAVTFAEANAFFLGIGKQAIIQHFANLLNFAKSPNGEMT